ncbi:uncharacterized protein LOC123504534 isoform X1 [Portunus trituberculatus]|uniref:uncharacterized protein LOC123504534 isoform X1 n=1 Tax=Portunus trituberculatus TaxID=210409 RepID=UPI001E1D1AA7|nr:uncharacterized protein LOC123504534 isoform X1 [Portunus trituberculatus]XP_045111054.1 uncharacterized protein LOC123504534 isoform X1 [Portunus trituberculatus]
MESSVEEWFTIMEAQFHLQRISSESTKFYHVLSALPPNVVKHEVIQLFERTKPELFEQLISTAAMTGRPSAYMNELLSIATKVGVCEDLVRHKFTQALPATIGTVLAAQKDLPLSRLAKLGDELIPLARGQQQCFSIDSSVSTPSTTLPRRQRQDDRRALRSYGLKPFHEGQQPVVCRAHLYFGANARTCKPWCRWPTKPEYLHMQSSSRPTSPTRSTTSEAPALTSSSLI